MKKTWYFILIIVVTMIFRINSVYADCSECEVDDCASCGCVLDTSAGICVYDSFSSETLSCGNNLIERMPSVLPRIVSLIYTVIQILVPVLLVVIGSLDFVKAVIAQKEDEIKKGQQNFIKRLIVSIFVFFVFALVKILVSLLADNDSQVTSAKIIDCVECLISNECDVDVQSETSTTSEVLSLAITYRNCIMSNTCGDTYGQAINNIISKLKQQDATKYANLIQELEKFVKTDDVNVKTKVLDKIEKVINKVH